MTLSDAPGRGAAQDTIPLRRILKPHASERLAKFDKMDEASDDGAKPTLENDRVWILPLGRRSEVDAVLKASAAGLLRCSSADYRMLAQARGRRRRESLCSMSVAATHRAVAAAVAVARDVKVDSTRNQSFFSPTKEAERARRTRSRSPTPQRRTSEPRSRARSASPATTPRSTTREATPRSTTRPSTTPPRARSQSPSTRRSPNPTPVTPPRRSTGTDIGRRSRLSSIPRSQTPPPSSSLRRSRDVKPSRSHHPDLLTTESPAALRRQIAALTNDLNRLKERHRRAVEKDSLHV